MTILARTAEHLVEYEAGFLSIARYTDGHCKAAKAKGIAGQFRACLRTHSPERVVETFLRMMRRHPWEPLYKPHRMPGADPEWDAVTGNAEILAALARRAAA